MVFSKQKQVFVLLLVNEFPGKDFFLTNFCGSRYWALFALLKHTFYTFMHLFFFAHYQCVNTVLFMNFQ